MFAIMISSAAVYKVKYQAIPMPVFVRYTFNDKGQIASTLSSLQ